MHIHLTLSSNAQAAPFLFCLLSIGKSSHDSTDLMPLSHAVVFLEEALVVGDVVYAIGPAGGDGSVLGAWALAFERMNG